jgi:hypothetical protein
MHPKERGFSQLVDSACRRVAMTMMTDKPIDDALDTISVAPPSPDEETKTPPPAEDKPAIREAHDADTHAALKSDPGHEDAKLDVGLDETFPSSDPPAASSRGHADPAPSSGYDEEAERKRAEGRD